jgi:hypothetical protein
MKIRAGLLTVSLFILIGSVSAQNKLQTGIWRGALKTSSGNELPFNFDVENIGGREQLAIHNSAERFKVTDIKTKGDSVFIHMPLFNSEFKLKFAGKGLQGQWIKHLADKDAIMDFTAVPNTS